MHHRIAVIFDMDGVLVDSYQAHFESWRQMAAEQGWTMTRKQFDATFGRTSREVIAQLWPEQLDREGQVAELDDRKEALFREILSAAFPAMAGARQLLYRLYEAGIAAGLGSSGPPENVQLTLQMLGVRPFLAGIVTGSDVKRGKPDPEVFLLTAQRLGIPPQRCVVVEDAPLGIEAARRAGMASVGLVSTGRTRELLHHADRVVGSLEELSPAIFRQLLSHSNGDTDRDRSPCRGAF